MRVGGRGAWPLGLLLLTGCAAERPWTPPPPATSATQAVSDFLAAVLDGRSGVAATVLSPDAVARRVGGDWLTDPPDLTDVRLGAERSDRVVSPKELGYSEIVFVPVTFHLDDADGGFPAGDIAWGYRVGRSAQDGWLILDNGAT